MRALILVDLQPDFMPGGALAVPHGDETLAIAHRLMPKFDVIVATQDWHPLDHGSFATNHSGTHPGELSELAGLPQVMWPAHCVQGTPGAELHESLAGAPITTVIRKGTDPTVDSYSGFFDNGHRKSTGLDSWLHDHRVDQLYVLGLATDYCVKFTVLDALSLGFAVWLVIDGCRAVELAPGDGERAIAEMRAAGATIVDSASIAT